MEHAMRRNLRLMQVFAALKMSLIAMPVIVPFWQNNGLSQTQIFLLQSAFAFSAVVLEVPSGYFADHYGRRTSLLLGAVLSALGFVVYGAGTGFPQMLAAELVLGLGYSFVSGADAALSYDTLLTLKEERRFTGFMGSLVCYGALAEAAASIAGGIIAIWSLRATVVSQVAVYALLIPVALLITEPTRQKASSGRNVLMDVLRVTKYALHGHGEIKWLIFYAAVAGTLTHTMVWLTQPYYQAAGVPIGWFGALWAAQLLALAAFARWLPERYERLLGRRRALASFILLGVAAYLVLGTVQAIWVLPVILVFYFIRAVHMPILSDYVNRLVESDVRATVLSVKNLVQKLLYMGLGPIIGWVMDVWSLSTALLFSAGIYGTLGLVVLLMMRRARIL